MGVLAKDSIQARDVFRMHLSLRKARTLIDFTGVIEGPDTEDPTSLPSSTRSKIAKRVEERNAVHGWDPRKSLRIGVPIEYNTEEMQPMIRNAWLSTLQDLRDRGHSIHQVSLPATKIALSAYYVLAAAEASSNLAKYDGVRYGNKSENRQGTDNVLFAATRGEGFGEEVKRRILLGSYSLSATAIDNYFLQAQKVRRIVQEDFNNVFSLPHPLLEPKDQPLEPGTKVDILLAPTSQSLPPKLSEIDGLAPTDAYAADVLTVPASLAGLPAMNFPVPIAELRDNDDGNELGAVGMQVLAQYGDDELVFDVVQDFEAFIRKQPRPSSIT